MYYSLNPSNGVILYRAVYRVPIIGVIKGDTRSSDYSSNETAMQVMPALASSPC